MSGTCAAAAAMIAAWLSGSASAIVAADQVLSIKDELGSLLRDVEASYLRGRSEAAIELSVMARYCALPNSLAGIELSARSLIVKARRLEDEDFRGQLISWRPPIIREVP